MEQSVFLFPAVRGRFESGEGAFPLPESVRARLEGFPPACLEVFAQRLGLPLAEGDPWLTVARVDGLADEAYRLAVRADGVRVEASTERGAIHALTSLWQLRGASGFPCARVEDAPRWGHRGLSLDCARRFFPVEEVERILEQMARAKMNVFHWHLSDDQGWRIESERFPRLQEVSGQFYAKADVRRVLAFAAARGIEVVPEIDMPGHTTAILAAYPELGCAGKRVPLATGGGIYTDILCAGSEKVDSFLEALLDEMCALFPGPRFHLGGDEAPRKAWRACPKCRARLRALGSEDFADLQGDFTRRAAAVLARHGKTAVCWNEMLKTALRPVGMIAQYWTPGSGGTRRFAEEGGRFVFSDMFELYLDYPYSMTPVRKIHEFTPCADGAPCADMPGLLGLECAVWAEHIGTCAQLEERLFPRLFAVAERAWGSPRDDYGAFLPRLERMARLAAEAGIAVTARDWWDPEGEARLAEALGYLQKMSEGIANAPETLEAAAPDADLAALFGRRFFRAEDAPILRRLLAERQ